MARQLISSFFPLLDGVLQRQPELYDSLLPPDCTPAVVHISPQLVVVMPTLLLLTAAGAAVGLLGAARLQHPAYRTAFACYAGMNAVASACHCFAAAGGHHRPLLAAADVGFTCATSLCLCLGALSRGARPRAAAVLGRLAGWVPCLSLAAAAAGNRVWRSGAGDAPVPVPGANELLYIATTLAAAGLLALQEVSRKGLSRAQAAALRCAAAAFVGFFPASTATHRALCARAPFADMTHQLFAACDAAMAALLWYLVLVERGGRIAVQANGGGDDGRGDDGRGDDGRAKRA